MWPTTGPHSVGEAREPEPVARVLPWSHAPTEVAREETGEEPIQVGRCRHGGARRPRRAGGSSIRVSERTRRDAVTGSAQVPVEVPPGDTVGLERRPGEPERSDHVRPEERVERRRTGGLEHQPEREVVRARVRVSRAPRATIRDRDELPRRELAVQQLRILRVVVEAGRVREEIADGDPVAVAEQSRDVPRDGVVEPQPPGIRQRQRERGDERLRDAADAEPIGRRGVPAPSSCTSSPSRSRTRTPGTPVVTTSRAAASSEGAGSSRPIAATTTAADATATVATSAVTRR